MIFLGIFFEKNKPFKRLILKTNLSDMFLRVRYLK